MELKVYNTLSDGVKINAEISKGMPSDSIQSTANSITAG